MHYISAAMNISLPRGVFQEVPAFSKQTGIIYIAYCSAGSTVGAGWHYPKYIFIIYHCPDKLHVCIQISLRTGSYHPIHTNLVLRTFSMSSLICSLKICYYVPVFCFWNFSVLLFSALEPLSPMVVTTSLIIYLWWSLFIFLKWRIDITNTTLFCVWEDTRVY